MSEFDHTQRLVASYILPLFAFSASTTWVKTAFGGWSVNGIMQAQTGDPLTVLAGSDVSQTNLGNDRANYIGGEYRGNRGCGATETPCVGYLNTLAFARPAAGSAGNLGKGALRGPGLWSWDMGFFKNVPIRERVQVQLRFEFFNIFNRANFQNPNTSFAAGGFGGIRGAYDPRIGQAALKVVF